MRAPPSKRPLIEPPTTNARRAAIVPLPLGYQSIKECAFLIKLGDQPRGLKALGFGSEHVEGLVEGTIPQARVLMLAPNMDLSDVEKEREQLYGLFEEAMLY